jgi:AcrR family transcriptional regulator
MGIMACVKRLSKRSVICRKETAMAFGKKGRPPEDRLARQRAIYRAVAPLILRDGVRSLSMRQAAHAACLSVGGLYHYFPTKRDLVLHGLCPEALLRVCQDFHARSGYLSDRDPRRYLDEGIEVIVEHVSLCRPAIHAALELGTDAFWGVIDTLLTNSTFDFEVHLGRLYPTASEQDLQQWGRAIRRAICAALLDKSVTPNELRDELALIVDSHVRRRDEARNAAVAAPIITSGTVAGSGSGDELVRSDGPIASPLAASSQVPVPTGLYR